MAQTELREKWRIFEAALQQGTNQSSGNDVFAQRLEEETKALKNVVACVDAGHYNVKNLAALVPFNAQMAALFVEHYATLFNLYFSGLPTLRTTSDHLVKLFIKALGPDKKSEAGFTLSRAQQVRMATINTHIIDIVSGLQKNSELPHGKALITYLQFFQTFLAKSEHALCRHFKDLAWDVSPSQARKNLEQIPERSLSKNPEQSSLLSSLRRAIFR